MTDDEFAAVSGRWCASYAQHLAPVRGLSADEATRVARAEFDQQLPERTHTAGQLLFTAVDDEGAAVGRVWLSAVSPDGAEGAWVSELEVDHERRGNGYGRQIMTLAEDVCLERGITKLRLNVFGSNIIARRLYESLGYSVLFQKMAKDLASPRSL